MKNNRYIKHAFDTWNLFENIYLDTYKYNDVSFTRNRKLPPNVLLMQMFANKGKSLKNECHDFFNQYTLNDDVSAWGYSKRRLEFDAKAIWAMGHDYIKKIYNDKDVKLVKLNDYFILSIDGSDLIIPSTDENYEFFGCNRQAKNNVISPCMSSISTMYDCLNKHILDINVDKYRTSERDSAVKHLENIKDIIPDKKILIFDRGYTGVKLIYNLLDNNSKFLFRLDCKRFKQEQESMKTDDEEIDIIFSQNRLNKYINEKELVERMKKEPLHLRMVKIPIIDSNGNEISEVLLTNLRKEEFDRESLKELYHLRWEIETSYRVMKEQLKLEQFSGYKPAIVVQDIYISTFLYNMIQGIITESKKIILQDRYKYQMEVNRNYSIGIIKTYAIKLYILYDKPRERNKIFNEMIEQINRYIVPKRMNRTSDRKHSINKCRMSYKNSY